MDVTEHGMGQLPGELRTMIWQYMIPNEQRIVTMTFDTTRTRYFSFGSSVPTVLHICRESRYVALLEYKLCFGTLRYPEAIPFCPNRDILFLNNWLSTVDHVECLGPLRDSEKNSTLRVAIVCGDSPHSYGYQRQVFLAYAAWLNQIFPNLQDLYLVIQNPDPYAKGPIKFVMPAEGNCDKCLMCYSKTVYAPAIDSLKEDGGVRVHVVLAYRGQDRSYLTDCTASQEPFARSSYAEEVYDDDSGSEGDISMGTNDDDYTDTGDETNSSNETEMSDRRMLGNFNRKAEIKGLQAEVQEYKAKKREDEVKRRKEQEELRAYYMD